jgi:hypothetical protein
VGRTGSGYFQWWALIFALLIHAVLSCKLIRLDIVSQPLSECPVVSCLCFLGLYPLKVMTL